MVPIGKHRNPGSLPGSLKKIETISRPRRWWGRGRARCCPWREAWPKRASRPLDRSASPAHSGSASAFSPRRAPRFSLRLNFDLAIWKRAGSKILDLSSSFEGQGLCVCKCTVRLDSVNEYIVALLSLLCDQERWDEIKGHTQVGWDGDYSRWDLKNSHDIPMNSLDWIFRIVVANALPRYCLPNWGSHRVGSSIL